MKMALEICGLSCGYTKKTDKIHDISFTLEKGSVLCVLGPNGSGKTTLFKALMRFLTPSAGKILWNGKNVCDLSLPAFSRVMSYIPQLHTPAFSYTVAQMAMMGRASHIPAFGAPGKNDEAIVESSLKKLDIFHLKDCVYTELSGGERRLALIARALCQQSQIIVMDEPSSDLDYANQQLVLQTVKALKEDGYSIILSTHAPEYPFSLADNALLLSGGNIVSCGPPQSALTSETLRQAFSVDMDVVEVTDSRGSKRRMCIPL